MSYRASGALEHGHAARRRLPVSLGDDGLEGRGGDLPELVVLSAEQDNDAVALGVEAGGHVLKRLGDDLLDALGSDAQVLVERIVAAAALEELDEGVCVGGHGCFGRGGCGGSAGGDEAGGSCGVLPGNGDGGG